MFRPLLAKVSLRIHPFVSYLDSDLSASLLIKASGSKIEIVAENAKQTYKLHKGAVSKLGQRIKGMGLFIPTLLFKLPPPGSGFHIGSSLPHGQKTDFLGRLPGFQRIHIADSSVLPSLEVGSITPTVMANAFRIARTALQQDMA
jgi:hypothetical protein